jgi:sulfur-oxidizing protein SoxA
VSLSERINLCRSNHQQAAPLAAEGQDLLSIESYVAFQSRGMPVAVSRDARLGPFLERGRKLYQQRIGQLDLACAQCHDDNAGQRLGGSVIPQAHPTGYPIYRLEWQGLGSLQRRLRNCITGVRAEAFPFGARELVELELYLTSRAAGIAVETPAVRP